jgi:hypothetical protein
MTRPSAAPWWAAAVVVLGGFAVYCEHLFSDPAQRQWAHYIADATQAAALWACVAIFTLALMRHRTARAVTLAACTWYGAEAMLTQACGIAGFFGATGEPGQWQGLCGRHLGLPLAAIGLTSLAVLLLALVCSQDARPCHP